VCRPVTDILCLTVTHFVLAQASNFEIPTLLAGKKLDSPSSDLGTGNDEIPAKALILGGAYHDDDVLALQELVEKAGGRHVAWLRVDSKTIGEMNPPDYAAEVGKRAKARVLKLEEEGKLDNVQKDSVYFV
jgi:hypothetical protein